MPRPTEINVELRNGTQVQVRVCEPEPVPGEPTRPESVPPGAVWKGDHWHTTMRPDNAREVLEPEGIRVRSVPEPPPSWPVVIAAPSLCVAGRHRREPGAVSPRTRGSRRDSRAGSGDDDPDDDESDLAGRRLQLAAAAILEHSQARGVTRCVLWTIAVHAAAGEGWRCAPGKQALADESGCARDTVKDALHRLAELGEVRKVGEAERDRQRHGEAIWELTLPGLRGGEA